MSRGKRNTGSAKGRLQWSDVCALGTPLVQCHAPVRVAVKTVADDDSTRSSAAR